MKKSEVIRMVLCAGGYGVVDKFGTTQSCSCMVHLPKDVILWLFCDVLTKDDQKKIEEKGILFTRNREFIMETLNHSRSLYDIMGKSPRKIDLTFHPECVDLGDFLKIVEEVCFYEI